MSAEFLDRRVHFDVTDDSFIHSSEREAVTLSLSNAINTNNRFQWDQLPDYGMKHCTVGLLSLPYLADTFRCRVTVLTPGDSCYVRIVDYLPKNDHGAHLFILLDTVSIKYYFLGRLKSSYSHYSCILPVNFKCPALVTDDAELTMYPILGNPTTQTDPLSVSSRGHLRGCSLRIPELKWRGVDDEVEPLYLGSGDYANNLLLNSSVIIAYPEVFNGIMTNKIFIAVRPLLTFTFMSGVHPSDPVVEYKHDSGGLDNSYFLFGGYLQEHGETVFKCDEENCSSKIYYYDSSYRTMEFKCQHKSRGNLLTYLPRYCSGSIFQKLSWLIQSLSERKKSRFSSNEKASVSTTGSYSLIYKGVPSSVCVGNHYLSNRYSVRKFSAMTAHRLSMFFKVPFNFTFPHLSKLNSLITERLGVIYVTGSCRLTMIGQFKLWCLRTRTLYIQIERVDQLPLTFRGVAILLVDQNSVYDKIDNQQCILVVVIKRLPIELLLRTPESIVRCETNSLKLLRSIHNFFPGHSGYLYGKYIFPFLRVRAHRIQKESLYCELSESFSRLCKLIIESY